MFHDETLQITKDKTVSDKELEELVQQKKDLEKVVGDLKRKVKNSDEEHQMKSVSFELHFIFFNPFLTSQVIRNNLSTILAVSFSTTSLQLFYTFSTTFLHLFYNFSTTFLHLLYNFFTTFLQLFYTFSTTFLLLFYTFSTTFLQLFYTFSTTILVHRFVLR